MCVKKWDVGRLRETWVWDLRLARYELSGLLLILRKNKLLLFFSDAEKDKLFNLSNSLYHQIIVSNPVEVRVYKHSAGPGTHVLPSTAPVKHLLYAIVLGPVPRWSSFCTS